MFWGATIDSHQPNYSITLPNDLRISNAALNYDAKTNGRNMLFVIVNDKKHPVCSLKLGKIENVSLNIIFSKGTALEFTTVGKEKISVCGNFIEEENEEEDEEDDYDNEFIDPYVNEDFEEDDFEEDDGDYDDEEENALGALLPGYLGSFPIDGDSDEEDDKDYSDDENNEPKIVDITSDEEVEERKKKKKNKNIEDIDQVVPQLIHEIPPQNIKKKPTIEDTIRESKEQKTKKIEKRKLKEEKAQENSKRSKIEEESNLYKINNICSNNVIPQSSYTKFTENIFVRDLVGIANKKISGGSVVYLYVDVFDNDFKHIRVAQIKDPLIFRSGVDKLADLISEGMSGIRWKSLRVLKIKINSLNDSQKNFFNNDLGVNIKPQSGHFVYLRLCPLPKSI